MPAAPAISHTDEINSRILAVSEDRIAGFVRDPMREIAKQSELPVDVVMERDEVERTVEAPPALKKALAKNKATKANWEKLSFTHKKEMALAIAGAKQAETRARRLIKIIGILETGAKWTG